MMGALTRGLNMVGKQKQACLQHHEMNGTRGHLISCFVTYVHYIFVSGTRFDTVLYKCYYMFVSGNALTLRYISAMCYYIFVSGKHFDTALYKCYVLLLLLLLLSVFL